MPDEPQALVGIRRTRLAGPVAVITLAALAAGAAIWLLVQAASPASGASTIGESSRGAGAEAPASVSLLFGLPSGVDVVDDRDAASIVDFAHLLTVVERREAAAPPAAPIEQPAVAPTPTVNTIPTLQEVLAPTSMPVPPSPTPTTTPAIGAGLDTSPMNAMEQALFDATNARRASQGLPALRVNGWLIGVGRLRSQDMASNNYFAHVSPITGFDAFDLMDQYGVPYDYAGENLAMNNYPADEAVGVADQALWDSPPHRENILNPYYTDMGIALRTSPSGMHYFTILFTGPLR